MAKSEGTFGANRPAWAQALDKRVERASYREAADDEITSIRYFEWMREHEPAVKDEQTARGRIEKMAADGILEFVGMRKNPNSNRPVKAYKFVDNNAKAKPNKKSSTPKKNSRPY